MSAAATTSGARPAYRRPTGRYRWPVLLPAAGMLGGIPFVNRVHPLVFGLPLLFAWIVGWVLVTSAVMGCILLFDRSNAAGREAAGVAAGSTKVR